MHIFLTGGTGFIGKQVLQELSTQHHIFVLVRSMNRMEHILKQLHLEGSTSITPVIGDLTLPRLGLQESDYRLLQDCDVIIHAGGPMNISLTSKEADGLFLQPAVELINIAREIHERKGLKHFIHVVGFMSPYNEDNRASPPTPLLEKVPPYERMKFKADTYIRGALQAMNIPLSTVNPSVVIGNSHSGVTEQIGGLSILVDAVRRRLMPLVPGGADYWLPMVHVDHAASFLSQLVDREHPRSNTYYLLDQKRDSLSIQALIHLIAQETRVSAPIGTVPLPLLKLALRLGTGKLLGIPAESMNFLVQSDFPVQSKLEVEQTSGEPSSVNPAALPFVVADLDFRLSHAAAGRAQKQNELAQHFTQRRRSNLVTLESGNEGTPLLFLHSTFSGADCFLPVARILKDANSILVDLPGFGRTPYHHHPSIIEGYVASVAQMILRMETPVVLVGHSFGGLIAAKVMERIGRNIRQLLLLQPVLHPIEAAYRYSFLGKQILKRITPSKFKKMMLQAHHFAAGDERLDDYADYAVNDLQSPRVRTTTAEVMAALTRPESIQLEPQSWEPDKVKILWGERDKKHRIPEQYEHIDRTYVPYGHQFPISEPLYTAQWIRQTLDSLQLS
ncbi:alpha/beta fold hydrolase [Paenibacillus oenotherae]|uniref:Alpha/beta fold hydrolase n=1 Tax=Paenibacillus oenotherae TaxID=1435645 RepID=A0ABS7D7Q1_9BACL|nr:alpha/beta fold hydrolase [Paenibacillus oenotherae]MBW7475871.1 alpha/beta fold hydrolase [Paenibacillus oenotherae]